MNEEEIETEDDWPTDWDEDDRDGTFTDGVCPINV